LERRGYVQAGPYTPEVVLEHPEAVSQMHRDFLRAGSEVIQALTFYGTADKLKARDGEINRAAIALARHEAGPDRWVAGGLSPTPTYRDGLGRDKTALLMRRHAELQAEAGIDLLIGETFVFLEEALAALEATQALDLPCFITMNVGERGSEDGFSPEQCAQRLEDAGAAGVGVNCSFGPVPSLAVARRMAQAVRCPVICQPLGYHDPSGEPFEKWAGFPLHLEPLQLSRADMADFARQARAQGIDFIGGCCGVAPYHIRAMAEALGRRPEGSCKSPDMTMHLLPEVRLRHALARKSPER
jgi:betaine-homocysteine S-methyltransferase